jgi:hypothetical protein
MVKESILDLVIKKTTSKYSKVLKSWAKFIYRYFLKYITNLGGMFINTKFRIICEVNNIVWGQISENFNSDKMP